MFVGNRFHIVRAGRYFSSSLITNLRTCPYYEIELYTKKGGVAYCDGNTYEKSQSSMIVALPGMTRQSIGAFECYYVHFECFDSACEDILKKLPFSIQNVDSQYFSEIFENIEKYAFSESDSEMLTAEGFLTLLIGRIASGCEKKADESNKYIAYENEINNVKVYLTNNFEAKVTLEDMAEMAHMSPSYFHNAFKTFTGKTPYEFLAEKRILNAKRLLINTDLPISEIAEKCGYTSQSYFNYAFKQGSGRTPKEYRKTKRFII